MNTMLHTKHWSLSEAFYKMWNELMFTNFRLEQTDDSESENTQTEQVQTTEG